VELLVGQDRKPAKSSFPGKTPREHRLVRIFLPKVIGDRLSLLITQLLNSDQIGFRIAQNLDQPLRLRTPIAHVAGHNPEMMHMIRHGIYLLMTCLIVPEIYTFQN
jgi:hypothetical protein